MLYHQLVISIISIHHGNTTLFYYYSFSYVQSSVPHLRRSLHLQKQSIKNQDEVINKQRATVMPSSGSTVANSTIQGTKIATSLGPTSSLTVTSTEELGDDSTSKEQKVQQKSSLTRPSRTVVREAKNVKTRSLTNKETISKSVTKRVFNPEFRKRQRHPDSEEEDFNPPNYDPSIEVYMLCVCMHVRVCVCMHVRVCVCVQHL